MSNDLVKRLRECSSDEAMWSRQAADRIEQLEAEVRELNMQVLASGSQAQEAYEAQLKAEAATAAAYEVAAGIASFRHDENQIMRATWATPKLTGLDDVSEDIRALATPDQTAALDRLIAEAEVRVWKRAMQAVDVLPEAQSPDVNVGVANAYAAIRTAASKKGGV